MTDAIAKLKAEIKTWWVIGSLAEENTSEPFEGATLVTDLPADNVLAALEVACEALLKISTITRKDKDPLKVICAKIGISNVARAEIKRLLESRE